MNGASPPNCMCILHTPGVRLLLRHLHRLCHLLADLVDHVDAEFVGPLLVHALVARGLRAFQAHLDSELVERDRLRLLIYFLRLLDASHVFHEARLPLAWRLRHHTPQDVVLRLRWSWALA